jgi:hypothetical protein
VNLKAYERKADCFARETQAVESVLFDDLEVAHALLATQDSDAHRRSFIRALFAMIDGVTFRLKLDVATFGDYDALELSDRDFSYLLGRAGPPSIYRRPRHLMIRPDLNFGYAISMYTLLYWPSYVIDGTDTGWSALDVSIGVRNRITHPKTASDLYVSDLDLTAAKTAEAWFVSLLCKIHKGCAKNMLRQLHSLRKAKARWLKNKLVTTAS